MTRRLMLPDHTFRWRVRPLGSSGWCTPGVVKAEIPGILLNGSGRSYPLERAINAAKVQWEQEGRNLPRSPHTTDDMLMRERLDRLERAMERSARPARRGVPAAECWASSALVCPVSRVGRSQGAVRGDHRARNAVRLGEPGRLGACLYAVSKKLNARDGYPQQLNFGHRLLGRRSVAGPVVAKHLRQLVDVERWQMHHILPRKFQNVQALVVAKRAVAARAQQLTVIALEQIIRPADHVPLLLFVPLLPEPPRRLLARAAVDALERRHPFRPELSARGAPPWNCEGLLLLLPLAREEVEPIAKVGLLRPSTLALVAKQLRVVPSCGWSTGMFRATSRPNRW